MKVLELALQGMFGLYGLVYHLRFLGYIQLYSLCLFQKKIVS